MVRTAVLALLGSLAAETAMAAVACRTALALGLDVSQSVDPAEYQLQLDGIAAALDDAAVRDALLNGGGTVALAIYEWSGPEFQRILLPWVEVSTDADIASIQNRLRLTLRTIPSSDQSTALGHAMAFGIALLDNGPQCWRRIIDISGDGRSNDGIAPGSVAIPPDVTINGLAIGSDDPATGDRRLMNIAEISAYYQSELIHGPNAFVETALGFEDFENAMRRKLLRELQALVLGDATDAALDQ